MLQNNVLGSIYLFVLLLNSILLISASLRSYKSIKALNITAFNHFVRSWGGLAFFWFGFVLIELNSPLYEIEAILLFNYIILFITPFLLEIFNFYLSLFSNRLNQFETYFPILIGITWGIAFGAIFSKDQVLLMIPLVLVAIISLFFVIYCIVIYIRIKKIEKSFSNENEPEIVFLRSIKMILIFTIVGGSYDAFWLPLAFIFTDYFYLISSIGFGFLALFTVLFLINVNHMIKILPEINISLIINELN